MEIDLYISEEIEILVGSGSGSGSSSGDGSSTSDDYDPCASPESDPGDTCGRLAMVEGSGSYTQDRGGTGASGKYQIIQSTAEGLIKQTGKANSDSEAAALWARCRSTDSPECRTLQDDLCKAYVAQLSQGLTGEDNKFRNLYLKWNMGPTGARRILEAEAGDGQVDRQSTINLMDNQAWTNGNPSNGDTSSFLTGLDKYINDRGVTSTASI